MTPTSVEQWWRQNMYLSDIANTIVTAIRSSSPGNWVGGLVVPNDMPVYDTLDPLIDPNTYRGLFVIPYYNELDLTKSRSTNRNTTPTGVSKTRRIIVGICCPLDIKLDTNSANDIGKKTEWSLLVNLQEDLENYLLKLSVSGLELVDIEVAPPDESFLDQRIYSSATVLGYKVC